MSLRPRADCSTGASSTTTEDPDERAHNPRPAHRPPCRSRARRRRPRSRARRCGGCRRRTSTCARRPHRARAMWPSRERLGEVRAGARAARASPDAGACDLRQPRRRRRLRAQLRRSGPHGFSWASGDLPRRDGQHAGPATATASLSARPAAWLRERAGGRAWPRRPSSRCTIRRSSPASRRSTCSDCPRTTGGRSPRCWRRALRCAGSSPGTCTGQPSRPRPLRRGRVPRRVPRGAPRDRRDDPRSRRGGTGVRAPRRPRRRVRDPRSGGHDGGVTYAACMANTSAAMSPR